ncbi:MAG: hypothetical protein M3310_00935, partial [Actinomycetota bacterium]|nr:hypothetical protein [Actinomycetota bacterium]
MALALACTSSAVAASPQQIYRDLADNGRLDRAYPRADLERALNPRQVLRTDERRPASSAGRTTPADAASLRARANASERRLPFSGLDLALLVAGGGPLLLIGARLRRRVASPPRG